MNFRAAFVGSSIIALILLASLVYVVVQPPKYASETTSTTTSEAQLLKPELASVTISETVDTYLGSGPVDIANDQGMFSRVGLTTNLITTPNSLQALEAGQVQFALSPPAFAADGQGGDIVSVAALLPNYAAAIIAQPGITSLSQLNGKTLGCLTAGQLLCTMEHLLIKSQNWTDTPGLVEPLGTLGALVAQFEQGQVQGFIFDWAVAVQLHDQGRVNILGSISQFVPSWYAGTIVTTNQFAATHPNTVRLFLTAMLQANLWITQHPNATQEWLMTHFGYSLNAAKTVYNNTQFSLTGRMEPSVVQLMYNKTASAQGIPPMNWESTYTNEYLPSIVYVPST